MRDFDDTPSRLVAAAERLFVQDGEEATSLRAITREAISNAAAVHYHFGGRDGLLRAVLDRHLGARHERRLRLLEKAGKTATVTAVLTAVVRPDLELLGKLRKHRVQVARFLGRAQAVRSPAVAEYLDRQFTALADRAVPMLVAAMADASDGGDVDVEPTQVRERLQLVLDAVAMLYARAADPGRPGPLGTNDVDEQVRRLVAFAAGALTAPVTKARRKRSS